MAGRISFGDEEEHAQTEALTQRILSDAATQHLIVGSYISRVGYTVDTWLPDDMSIRGLDIEFANGLRIYAPQAKLDLRKADPRLRDALQAEYERTRPERPGTIREAGDKLLQRPGPELDSAGDPIERGEDEEC